MNQLPFSFQTLANLIAETFDASPSAIGPDTRCADVPGWDSLGHSVLLSRLDRKFHLGLIEADAAPTETVQELLERLLALARETSA